MATTTTVDTQAIVAGSGGTSTPVKLTLQSGTQAVSIQLGITTTRAAVATDQSGGRREFTLYWAFSPDDLTLANVPTLLRHCAKSQSMVMNTDIETAGQRQQVRDKVNGQYLYVWFGYPGSLDAYAVVIKATELFFLSSATDPTFTTITVTGSTSTPTVTSPAATALTLGTGTSGAAITVLSASNNVGIGTASPQYRTEINGSGSILALRNSTESVNQVAALKFVTGSGSEADTNILGSIVTKITQADPSALKSEMFFQINNGDSETRIMTLKDGNVGIGKTTPEAKLHIIQTTEADASTGFNIQRTTNDSQLWQGYNTGSDVWQIASTYSLNGAYKPLTFWTSSTERVRIKSDGDVTISSTTAGAANAGALVIAGGISAGNTGSAASYFGGAVSGNRAVSTGVANTNGDISLTINGNSQIGTAARWINQPSSAAYNWQLGTNLNGNWFSFMASTVVDGTTFSTDAMKLTNTGAATFAGAVAITKADADAALAITASTGMNPATQTITNTGGTLRFGLDNSSQSYANNGLYATFISRPASTNFVVLRGSTTDLLISSTGAATFAGTVTSTQFQSDVYRQQSGNRSLLSFSVAETVLGSGAAGDTTKINANGVQALRIDASLLATFAGAVSVGTGAAVGGATAGAGGLAFPATAVAVADANTLDDYEEGTWTPALYYQNATGVTRTYTAQDGGYTKIGNTVTVWGFISGATSNSGSYANDNIGISGLPFPTVAVGNAVPIGPVIQSGFSGSATVGTVCGICAGSTALFIQTSSTTGNLADDFGAGATYSLYFTATYRT